MSQPTTQSTAGPLLKELLTLPPVRVLNDKSWLHDKLTKETAEMDFGGKYARFPVTLRRALGRGSRGDAGSLPGAVPEVIEDAKVYMKRHYYALEWSEAMEEASKNKAGAFEKVVTMKMKNVATDMAVELNRQWYNAANGALASTTNSASGLTHVIDDTQFVQIGDLIDIVAPDTGVAITNGTARSITAVDRTASTITLDAAGGNVDPAGTEIIVLNGNYGNEIEGLRAVAETDRDLYGIDSTTYENWNGKTLDAEGGVAGESLFERLYDKIGRRGAGDMDTYATTRGIRRRLADEFASQRRYLNEKATSPTAGYSMVEVNNQEVLIDDGAPRRHVFGFKRDVLKVLKMTDPGFIETEAGDGAKIELKNSVNGSGNATGGKDAVWQTWYRYHNTLVATDPSLVGKIYNAEDDADDE
ncbi:MAG TPA: phage major capsid protein [Baekduia sp.]|nr:phage major capsid protein [Baekduia sp.]